MNLSCLFRFNKEKACNKNNVAEIKIETILAIKPKFSISDRVFAITLKWNDRNHMYLRTFIPVKIIKIESRKYDLDADKLKIQYMVKQLEYGDMCTIDESDLYTVEDLGEYISNHKERSDY